MNKIKIYEELLNRTLLSLKVGIFHREERKLADKLYDDICKALRESNTGNNRLDIEDTLHLANEKED